MKVSVLWEDQRADGKDFGPDQLLKSCIADDRGENPFGKWWRWIKPLPQKGKDNLLATLVEDFAELGPPNLLFAVLDRDRAHELCGLREKPVCKSELLKPLRQKAPGEFEIILLEQNLESLVIACCEVLGREPSRPKPKRDERDEILRKLAFHQEREKRYLVRQKVGSFDRLVKKVGERIASLTH